MSYFDHLSVLHLSTQSLLDATEWMVERQSAQGGMPCWIDTTTTYPRVVVIYFKDAKQKTLFDLTWSDKYKIYASVEDAKSDWTSLSELVRASNTVIAMSRSTEGKTRIDISRVR